MLTASDNENPDLFFAIRGGGGNFGVATEFVLKLHSQRSTVYAGRVIFTQDKLKKIIEAISTWFPGAGEKEAVAQGATIGPGGNVSFRLCVSACI